VKVEYQLADLESKLAKLKAGHEEGAKVLRQKALALAALPREMRDAIFEQIYIKDTAIEVTWSRLGNNHIFEMPKDTGLYMSSLHVGPELAREAAEIFYKRNTFTFVRAASKYATGYNLGFSHWERAQLDSWFARDHYGSGVVPTDFIRNLEIRLDPPGHSFNGALLYSWENNSNETKLCNHIAMESLCDNVSQDWQDYRSRLRGFLQYSTLQQVRFVVSPLGHAFDTVVRIINPVVREFQAAGVKVILQQYTQKTRDTAAEELDLSNIFEVPSDEDLAAYFARTQRKSTFVDDPERDTFDTWKIIDSGAHAISTIGNDMVDAYVAETEKREFMRVWMHEHYEMYKFLKRDHELFRMVGDMVREFRSLDPEERDLRWRLYPRIMSHFR
jgi:hypothetical protein